MAKSVLNPADYMSCVAVGYIAGAVNAWVHQVFPDTVGSTSGGILTGMFLLGIALVWKNQKKDNPVNPG